MTVRLGERQSWEDAQLAIISQDHHLLNIFQTLKYVNSKFITNQRSQCQWPQLMTFKFVVVALLVPLYYDGLQRNTQAGNFRPSLSTITALHSALRYVELFSSVVCSNVDWYNNFPSQWQRRRIWTCVLFFLSLRFLRSILRLKWKLPKCLFMFNRYILPPIFLWILCYKFAWFYLTIDKFRRFLFVKISTSLWSSKVLRLSNFILTSLANVLNVGQKVTYSDRNFR